MLSNKIILKIGASEMNFHWIIKKNIRFKSLSILFHFLKMKYTQNTEVSQKRHSAIYLSEMKIRITLYIISKKYSKKIFIFYIVPKC